MDEFEKSVFGELFEESGDDIDIDFEKEMKDAGIEESGDDDDAVSAMLNGALGDDISDDPEEDEDDDLAELEKEFHATQAGEVDEEGDDDIPDPDIDECGSNCASEGCSNPSEGCGTADEGFEDEIPPLDPSVDMQGDRVLAAIMTPELLSSGLDAAEFEEFVESGDASIASAEGFLTDEYLMEAFEDPATEGIFEEAAFAPEGRKYKMTKSAKLKQLYEVSLQIEARLHKDPQYKVMQKVYKARRTIRNNWRKRYGSLAMRRARKYLKALIRSKSSGLNKIASRLTGK